MAVGGGGWCLGPKDLFRTALRPTPPPGTPTSEQLSSAGEIKSIEEAGDLRPISGPQTLSWPMTHPPAAGGSGVRHTSATARAQAPANGGGGPAGKRSTRARGGGGALAPPTFGGLVDNRLWETSADPNFGEQRVSNERF